MHANTKYEFMCLHGDRCTHKVPLHLFCSVAWPRPMNIILYIYFSHKPVNFCLKWIFWILTPFTKSHASFYDFCRKKIRDRQSTFFHSVSNNWARCVGMDSEFALLCHSKCMFVIKIVYGVCVCGRKVRSHDYSNFDDFFFENWKNHINWSALSMSSHPKLLQNTHHCNKAHGETIVKRLKTNQPTFMFLVWFFCVCIILLMLSISKAVHIYGWLKDGE